MNIKEGDFMNSIMQKIQKFMIGRYGADQLGVALMIAGCILTFALSFSSKAYFRLFGMIPYAAFLFRALSRNIAARRKENAAFLKYWNPVKAFFIRKKRQYDDKAHKYYSCPRCRRVLRVPAGRGKIEICCPYCQRKFIKNTGSPKVDVG